MKERFRRRRAGTPRIAFKAFHQPPLTTATSPNSNTPANRKMMPARTPIDFTEVISKRNIDQRQDEPGRTGDEEHPPPLAEAGVVNLLVGDCNCGHVVPPRERTVDASLTRTPDGGQGGGGAGIRNPGRRVNPHRFSRPTRSTAPAPRRTTRLPRDSTRARRTASARPAPRRGSSRAQRARSGR